MRARSVQKADSMDIKPVRARFGKRVTVNANSSPPCSGEKAQCTSAPGGHCSRVERVRLISVLSISAYSGLSDQCVPFAIGSSDSETHRKRRSAPRIALGRAQKIVAKEGSGETEREGERQCYSPLSSRNA